METISKEMEKKVSAKEAPSLEPYGYKEGDVMKNIPGTLDHWEISFEEYKKSLAPYTLEYTAQIAKGDPNEDIEVFKKKLQALADLYIEKGRKVVSFWTMGMNQHTRGTWVNTQSYNVHFMLNKQAKPGSGAFSSDWTAQCMRNGQRSGNILSQITSRHDGRQSCITERLLKKAGTYQTVLSILLEISIL